MQDETILKKLRELIELDTIKSHKYITAWIEELQTSMAVQSAKEIGMGSSLKSIKKIIDTNKKHSPEYAKVIRSNSNKCVVANRNICIVLNTDLGLPATSLLKDSADIMINAVNKLATTNTIALTTPSRAELDYIIKDWKAMPSKERTPYPIYCFDKVGAKVNAKDLLEMCAVFPSSVCWVNPNLSAHSPILFKWELYTGSISQVQ